MFGTDTWQTRFSLSLEHRHKHVFFFSPADFGVSAKNTKTLQRRDSFIGTPYWWASDQKITGYHHHFSICTLLLNGLRFLLFPFHSGTFSCTQTHTQDGARSGDVRDIEGQAVWLQGRYLVPRCHPDWDGSDRAAESRDESHEGAVKNRQGRPTHSYAALQMVRQNERQWLIL